MANLQKIVNLIKKTGDKAIVLDSSGEPSYVIMTLSDYERLVIGKTEVIGLSEEEMLEKINRDIEVWKDAQNSDGLGLDEYDFAKNLSEFSEFNDIEDDYLPEYSGQDQNSASSLSLSDTYAKISLKKEEEGQEEDRYYFEPVDQV
ncbi:MAG: hypothetical protein WCP18_01765 [bacterium]